MINFLGNIVATIMLSLYFLLSVSFPFLAIYGLIQLFS